MLYSLRDENVEVGRAAIIALGKLGRGLTEVEDHLRESLADPDRITSMKAAVALVMLDVADESAIPSLMGGLGDRDETVVRSASLALEKLAQRLPDKVLEAVGDALAKNQEPLLTNAVKFVRIAKSQQGAMLSSLADAYDKVPAKVRVLVLTTIAETDQKGDQAAPVVAKALRDRDAAVRREAVRATLRFRNRLDAFKPGLLAALSDPNPDNRAFAVQATKGISRQMPEAVPKLVALADDRDHPVKLAALSALGSFNDLPKKAIRVLKRNAGHEDPRVRAVSLTSLGDLSAAHSVSVTPLLERLLNTEKDPKNRRIIVYSLQRAGKRTAHDVPSSLESGQPKRFRPGEEIGGYR